MAERNMQQDIAQLIWRFAGSLGYENETLTHESELLPVPEEFTILD